MQMELMRVMQQAGCLETYEIGGCQMEILTGDIIKLKKKHPCGSFEWEVLRSGADFRLKCCGCEHQIMVARKLVEKNIRKQMRNGEEIKIIR